jgi:hypothetical protein
MEESLESGPPDIRKMPLAPPLPPEGIDRPGIDLGAFSPSFCGSGSARSSNKRPLLRTASTHSGQDASVSAAAAFANPADDPKTSKCVREDYDDKFDATRQFLQ